MPLLLFLAITTFSQNHFTVVGHVRFANDSIIENANVILNNGTANTYSDVSGDFKLQLNQDKYHIEVYHNDYKPTSLFLNLTSDTTIIVNMIKNEVIIDEITVNSSASNFIHSTIPGKQVLLKKEILAQPSLFGEKDIINIIQKKPGVQSVSEGIAGLYVRGGDAGQNKFIYDDMELIDPSHLMGTFSSFNPYLLKNVEFYKGNMPIEYADRLSSVLVAHSFNNVSEIPTLTIHVGTMASSFALGIGNKKLGMLMGGRRSQLEIYQEAITQFSSSDLSKSLIGNNYRFSDLNGKFYYYPNQYSSFSLSFYTGGDDLNYIDKKSFDIGLGWNNSAAAFKWIRDFNTINYKVVAGYSQYDLYFNGKLSDYRILVKNNYKAFYLKQTLQKTVGRHEIKLHTDAHKYEIQPNETDVQITSELFNDQNQYNSAEINISASDRWQLTDQLTIHPGIKFNYFSQFGKAEYQYQIEEDTITTKYSNAEHIQSYVSVLPQFYVVWNPRREVSVKFAYSRNNQNIHRASLASLPLPADIWISSTKYLKPEIANQISLGIYKQHHNWQLSSEVYYKKIENLLLFEPNLYNTRELNFEENFISGEGYSTGVELLLEKRSGKLTGHIGYGLSKTQKKIAEVNDGRWFDAKYDRTHDLSIIANYKFIEHWELSATYILASGNTTTIPSGRYYMMGYIMNEYDEINGFRLPMYSRVDVGINYCFETKRLKSSELNLSIINLLNRKNPYFFFYEMRGDIDNYNLTISPCIYNLFPIIPSISWTFTI